MMASVRITVVGDEARDERDRDDELYGGAAAAAVRTDELRASSAEQMVAAILNRLGPDDRIAHLDIADHGTRHGQKIGHSWLEVGSPAMRQLGALRPKMARGGLITLQGCHAGHSYKLMRRLSALLGVHVQAGAALEPSASDLQDPDDAMSYPPRADQGLFEWLDEILFH